MNHLPCSFPNAGERGDIAMTRHTMARYVAGVRADVLTTEAPEALAYMKDTGGTFADFVYDEGFTCAVLGVPFRWDDGIDTPGGRMHRDALFVAAVF